MSDVSKPLFVLGTTSSAFLAGGVSYISLLAIPSFLDAPNNTTLLTQWSHLVNIGTRTARTLTIFSASCQLLNAWVHYIPSPGLSVLETPIDFLKNAFQGGRVGKFLAAGLATISIIPVTLFVMKPMNKELLRRQEISFNALEAGDGRSANKLSDRGYLTPSGFTPRVDLDLSSTTLAEERKNKEETTNLVRRWGRWNLVRAVGPLLGTWLAFEAL